MPGFFPNRRSALQPFFQDENRRDIVHRLLATDQRVPLLIIEDESANRTRIMYQYPRYAEEQVIDGTVQTAINQILREGPAEATFALFIELCNVFPKDSRSRRDESWDNLEPLVSPFLDRGKATWGPLLAAASPHILGAKRAVIHIPSVYLFSPLYAEARRTLLEHKLIEQVAFTRQPLSAPAAQRDCYLVIAEGSASVTFSNILSDDTGTEGEHILPIVHVSSDALRNTPEASLSVFNAKVTQNTLRHMPCIGDIAYVLKSVGTTIRRNGELSNNSDLPCRYISIADFDHGALKPNGTFFDDRNLTGIDSSELHAGDILIARNATAGSVQLCPYGPRSTPSINGVEHRLIASENVLVLRPDHSSIPPYALYAYLAFGEGQDYIKSCRLGSAMGSISARNLLEIPAPMLDDNTCQEADKYFSEHLATIEEYRKLLHRIAENERKAMQLGQLMQTYESHHTSPQ